MLPSAGDEAEPHAQDYAQLGIRKIAEQAARDPRVIRCPRDGAVMRVLGAGAHAGGGLDVECPACGRRALGIEPAGRAAEASPL